MEDLGEAIENFVETFSCTEEPSSRLRQKAIPTTHANLLTSSSLYGLLCTAVGSSIAVYSHAALREGDASPVAVVNLGEEHVTSIHALALGACDTIAALVTTTLERSVVILNISALASGKIHALPGPSGLVSAFCVSDVRLNGPSQVLATLEQDFVQLHNFGEDGTTPRNKITSSNARCIALSPQGDLLAVGTERGRVIIYDTNRGEACATIVEVESGWVPFSTHFADNRSVVVSYNCDTEVRHVVWHLSSDGAAVTGHSPLGELCLTFHPFDEEEPSEAPMHPMMTYISLHEWSMCIIGSSMSSDVEIIRKTDSGWEVWKFDEGKSPTLPTDDNDDDTYCVGLAFDLNNTALIPGPDPASPKINPMPWVIVYTSDSLLLPFALIDSNPGVRCEAVGSAVELPSMLAKLRSIESVSTRRTEMPSPAAAAPEADSASYQVDPFDQGQKNERPSLPDHGGYRESASSSTSEESDHEELRQTDEDHSIQRDLPRIQFELLEADQIPFTSSNSVKEPKSSFGQQQAFEGMNSFLDNFSLKETPAEHPKPKTAIPSFVSCAMKPDHEKSGLSASTDFRARPNVSLAPSLDAAEVEANGGDIFGLLKSILTEMSEELKVNAEAERVVSQEIAMQKNTIASSIAECRKQLTELLQITRTLFRNEAALRNNVSSTLSKVLSLSREYEKMSLEFHIKEADGFSRSLRAEEKELDDKIASKEGEVLRSISSIEDRLNAETEIQTGRKGPKELVQQVYSSLSLQGIRIKRVRSLLTALSERMDNQDKGGRLSHLGLSLARLEKLNIKDEEVGDHPQNLDKSKERGSVRKDAVGMPNGLSSISRSHATVNQGDDTQLLPADVRAVMRRLAMSGGRANISVPLPQSRVRMGRIVNMEEKVSAADVYDSFEASFNGSNRANLEPTELFNATSTSKSDSRILGFSAERRGDATKTEGAGTAEVFPNSAERGRTSIKNSNNSSDSGLRTERQRTYAGFASPSSDIAEVYHRNTLFGGSAVPSDLQANRPQFTSNADGAPSPSLPPKKPLGMPVLPPSAHRSTAVTAPLGSKTFGDNKSRGSLEVSIEHTSERLDDSSGETVESNTTKERSSEPMLPSRSLFSTSGASEGISSRGISRFQVSSHPSGEGLPPNVTATFAAPPAMGVEKSTKPRPTQFASLPPDDDGGDGTRRSPIVTPAPQFASLPPDDNKVKPRTSLDGSGVFPLKKDEAKKKVSMPGFFAALPPDSETDAISRSTGDKLETPLASQAQKLEEPAKVSELFAALPPDPDTDSGINADSSQKGRSTSLFESSGLGSLGKSSIPSAELEALGTSDLFAALPPDHGDHEHRQQSRVEARFPFESEAKQDLKKTVISPVDEDENGNKPRADQPLTSVLDPTPKASTSAPKTGEFGSPFGALQQSTVAFGKASLFGASSTANQSAPATIMSGPERQSSRDGTSSDESGEEPTRLEAGMDTSSVGGGFFGASSFPQGNKQVSGFGSKPDSTSATTGFGQSSASPFGSFSRSQLFGQPASSQKQTGFESLAGLQGSVAPVFQSAQPTFGSSSVFDAASAAPTFGVESTFGAESQLGASMTFGVPTQLGIGSTPLSSSNPTFGGGIPAPKFGESSFGVTPSFGSFGQSSTTSGFGGSSSASGASPFGNVAAGAFGGASGGGSGFAALAGGQSGGLIFGNGGGPPAFTSAAFSQRRA